MTRSAIETVLGAVVIAVAAFFLVFSYRTANVGAADGYHVYADFSGIGGLKTGDDVQISGVKVGQVSAVELVPDTYLARVHMSLGSNVTLPADTAAAISSESLLGGRYMALSPGSEEETIPQDGKIEYTQAPQNLEQLLGQFIFSMQDEKKKSGEEADAADASPAPEPAAPETPAAAAMPPMPETPAP
ncbi:MAG: outer membrane lipid asymmetry maintenance protein MlaD [Alphaproteobacteria bacterium]|nr:outer membrane lipid asymmetry maintenance protein MlaD [Alphaproteobacteria bacterium]